MAENTPNVILDEMKTAHEALKGYVDKQIEETRKAGVGRSDLDETINKINTHITELRCQLEEAIKAYQRPAAKPGKGDLTPEQEVRMSAFDKYLRHGIGESGRAVMTPEEIRSLSSVSDAKGGFLVPVQWEQGIIMAAYDQAEVRPICNVGSTGRDTVYMGALSKPTVAWGSKDVAVSPQTLAGGIERLEVFDCRALTLIHNNTLDDSDADIYGELSTAFAQAVAEAEDDAFVVGVGDDSPQGVLGHATVLTQHTHTGVAAALSDSTHNGIDALIGALYGLKKVYRRNSSWAFNSATEGLVRKLKDVDGQYLWQPPVQAGAPALLLGRPIINPEGMPDVGAGTYPIIIGDFKAGYRIRDRKGLTVTRLVERYAEYDQTGFMIKRRTAGQVVQHEAFQLVLVAA